MTNRKLTILQINDTHGYLEPHHELVWRGGEPTYPILGGYARISSLIHAVRRSTGNAVIALDNGDTLHGTFPAVNSRGDALIPLLNALGLDGMTAHWEFAYGAAHLRTVASRLSYPLLAINCYERGTNQLVFPPTHVVERGGLRIGIIGIAATIIDKGMPPSFSEGVRFTLGRDELPDHIARLRNEDRVDLVIVLSHLGFPQDYKLATEVAGIDVLLSGHTHNRLVEPVRVNNAIIIQSGCHGSFVGRLDLEFGGSHISAVKHQLISIDETIEPDRDMQAMVDSVMAPHRQMLDAVVGSTRIGLNRNTIFEATMDNLLLDAIADAAGTALAFSNGWRYGAPVPPGPIKRNDLWNIIPTNPPVSTVEITGHELWSMMEENLERTFCVDPYEQMGGYVKRCRGLNIYAKIENPSNHRIEGFLIDGAPLRRDHVYQAAFVTEQAVPSRYGRNHLDLNVTTLDALEQHLGRNVETSPALRGAVVAI